MLKKFSLLVFIALLAACGSSEQGSSSDVEDYPTKNINFIVQYGAGGGTDIAYRTVTDEIESALNTTILVENEVGGGGITGATKLANADPDGYTAGVVAAGQLVHAPLFKEVPVGLEDYKMAGSFGEFLYGIIAPPDSPFDDFEELVDHIKENPGKVAAANVPATISDVVFTWMENEFDLDFNLVPFESSADAQQAMMSGSVDFTFATSPDASPLLLSDDLKLLAAVGEERWDTAEDVPTLIELGYENANVRTFLGIGFPADTPDEIIDKWEEAIGEALKDEELLDKFDNMGIEPNYMDADEFKSELEKLDSNLQKMMGNE